MSGIYNPMEYSREDLQRILLRKDQEWRNRCTVREILQRDEHGFRRLMVERVEATAEGLIVWVR